MAHKTLIDGTAYDIKGGKTLIDGTGYSIKGGRTLVDGTGYGISFGITWKKYSTTATTTYTKKSASGTSTVTYSSDDTRIRCYSEYQFSTSSGFSGTGTVSVLNGDSTGFKDKYLVEKTSVKQYASRKILSATYDYEWTMNNIATATKSTSYSKGSTLYGEVVAAEGAVPDGGTLYSGSVTGSYCIVNVGGTYYYYERA